jgi:hypothetical protein
VCKRKLHSCTPQPARTSAHVSHMASFCLHKSATKEL